MSLQSICKKKNLDISSCEELANQIIKSCHEACQGEKTYASASCGNTFPVSELSCQHLSAKDGKGVYCDGKEYNQTICEIATKKDAELDAYLNN